MAKLELKPCPFCGGTEIEMEDNAYMRCTSCGASSGWKYDPVEAIEAWNNRATENKSEHIDDIMQAVTEYNKTNGNGYEKPWPQDGDTYLWIGSTGFIHESDYDDDAQRDSDRREFGNMFPTREEAEAALERVKKALKGE